MAHDTRRERLERRLSGPTLAAALLVIPVIVGEETHLGEPWSKLVAAGNWAIWLTFAFELVVMVALPGGRRAWIRSHPLEFAIVLMTPPFLPAALQSARAFRLLRLLRLVVGVKRIKAVSALDGLRLASVVAVFGVIGAGTAFAGVESEQHLSTWDGIWWAITTVSTVGYGDVVPKTDAGRVLAIVVMFVGVGYVAVLTSTLVHYFQRTITRGVAAVDTEVAEAGTLVLKRIDDIGEQLAALQRTVDELHRQRSGGHLDGGSAILQGQ